MSEDRVLKCDKCDDAGRIEKVEDWFVWCDCKKGVGLKLDALKESKAYYEKESVQIETHIQSLTDMLRKTK